MSTYQLRTLIKNILDHYVELELQSTSEYKLWCNSEFDSNVTEFERLSNMKLINVKTKLDKSDVRVIIHILNAIVQENYYIFKPNEMDVYIDDSISELIAQYNKDKIKLYKYNCPKLWIKWLRIAQEDNNITQTDNIVVSDNLFEYTVLEVKDINVNLRLTKNKMVEIIK